MRQKRVLILGCGPTGLLCAHAAVQHGHEPIIISRKVKSVIPGSQHLHGPVPGLTSVYPEGTIQFVRIGTAEGYAEKVYGDPNRNTGWENYLQVFPSWNIIRAYDRLWRGFEKDIRDEDVDIFEVISIIREVAPSLVISTLPAKTLCTNPKHEFLGSEYYIQTLPTPEADVDHEIVVYNGLPDDAWYRWSILAGKCSIEYPSHKGRPDGLPNVIVGTKAVTTTCDCWPNIKRLGRWAEWTHGVTMHRAYTRAVQLMEEL